MITSMNCATGTLAPYQPSAERPWNTQRAMHLFRRLSFGASPQRIAEALTLDPVTLVNQLLNEAMAQPVTEAPAWADLNVEDYDEDVFVEQSGEQYTELITGWTGEMLQRGVREKMTLFWSNHFVTKFEAYLCGSYLYRYHTLLQANAFGNFKDFTKSVGRSSAMLVFLNGIQNTRFEPNENYARELYELFTLGADNGYTQQDITETARALTGFQNVQTYCDPIDFTLFTHDNGVKTIFGQTGNWGFDDVHDILFEQRGDQIANFICSKIYRYFVNPDVDETIVAQLAQTFRSNDWEIAPVLRQLFRSEHFFDEANIGVRIKDPIEWFLNFVNETDAEVAPMMVQNLTYFTYLLGQQLHSPPDVSGWEGNRAWVNGSNLTGRWQGLDFLIFSFFTNQAERLRDLAKQIAGAENNDPEEITRMIVDHWLPKGFQTEEEYERATVVFKGEVPQNYFDSGEWNLEWSTVPQQVAVLLYRMVRTPEFQLG